MHNFCCFVLSALQHEELLLSQGNMSGKEEIALILRNSKCSMISHDCHQNTAV